MKVTLATIGCFHMFALAKELDKHGYLECIYSGFTWSRLKREGVVREKVKTYPVIRPILMATRYLPFNLPESLLDLIHQLSVVTLDNYVARTLPRSSIYVGHEAVGLISGATAKRRGMLYVCDRGCTHMAWRERILQEENERLGLKKRRQPNTYSREIDEYEQADLIVVPSEFAAQTFINEGIAKEKLAVVPYGVDLKRFYPVLKPMDNRFDVIFVGAITSRKGVKYLLDGFQQANIPNKHLTLIGTVDPELSHLLSEYLIAKNIDLVGHVQHDKLKELFSRSHVFCLPSIEEGFGMVVAEAMACACPVIVSTNVGGAALVKEGENGFVIPIRDPHAIAKNLELLASNPVLREQMSRAALESVNALGGWETYGLKMIETYQHLIESQ